VHWLLPTFKQAGKPGEKQRAQSPNSVVLRGEKGGAIFLAVGNVGDPGKGSPKDNVKDRIDHVSDGLTNEPGATNKPL